MALWYPPPPPVVGRNARGQPHDGSGGLPPSLLNNPPPPGSNPIPNAVADFYNTILVAWSAPPPRPVFKGPLPAKITNNPVTQGGGWNQHDPQFALIVNIWNLPPPPIPVRVRPNPVLLNRVDAPPRYSSQLLQVQANFAWQVTWGSPPLKPMAQPRAIVVPTKTDPYSWKVKAIGTKTKIRAIPNVDSETSDQ